MGNCTGVLSACCGED
jgi:hypothetical protein